MTHFEELWEEAENFHKDQNPEVGSSLDEIILKINLYKVIDLQKGFSVSEKQNMKLRTMGEILLSLTAISLKDEINVFEALGFSLRSRD